MEVSTPTDNRNPDFSEAKFKSSSDSTYSRLFLARDKIILKQNVVYLYQFVAASL